MASPFSGTSGLFSTSRTLRARSLIRPGDAQKETKVKTILIVGEDEMLSYTRAQLLREWKTVTTNSTAALETIRTSRYDLLILCHTVRDLTARTIIAQANELYPGIKSLAICEEWQNRELNAASYTSEPNDPASLRKAVASVLD
jgi:CheY-like chemotaxis protein